MAVGVPLLVMAAGCGTGQNGQVHSPGGAKASAAAAARKLPGGGLLSLVPGGPNLVVWVDIEALRAWPGAHKLSGSQTRVTEGRIHEYRKRFGLDPWRDLDRLVFASKLAAVSRPGVLDPRKRKAGGPAGSAAGGSRASFAWRHL